jgi:nucleoside-diphosphate-sugar epimerase
MIQIVVIGASGQVGTEVCLYLKTYPEVRPVAVVRTHVSGALLRRLGIEVRVGVLGTESESRELLRDSDMIVDFSAPAAGEMKEFKAHYERHVRRAVACAPEGARYVFVSTINAFGMSPVFNRAKHYFLPHTIYAHSKRFAERLACRLGRLHRREVYIFRLGHVHGALQRVSQETAELVRQPYRSFEYPDTPSYTIFCHSIAEGLVNVARGKDAPGTYTLISEPAWSWREVLKHYSVPHLPINVVLRPTGRTGLVQRLGNAVRAWLGGLAQHYQDTLRANVLHHFPAFERKCQAGSYLRKAHSEIQAYHDHFVYRPSGIHEGVIPGRRLPSLSDSRVTMGARELEVGTRLACLKHRHLSPAQPAHADHERKPT